VRCCWGQRTFDPFKGWWDLLGGFVEEGETLEEACKRELQEETGLEATDLAYIGSFAEEYHFKAK